MSSSQSGGRAGRPRQLATACAVAVSSLLLSSSAAAHGAALTGTAGPGLKRPAEPSTRIAGGTLGYDPADGTLAATVRLAAPTGRVETPALGVSAYAGTWRDGRCGRVPELPEGVVSGLPDTFGYPPVADPGTFFLTQVRLAALGEDTLDPSVVTVSLSGTSVVMTARSPVLAGKEWNCGWFRVSDQGQGARERGFPVLDETAPFALAAPGAGVTLAGRALRVQRGRVVLTLRNAAAAASGRVTIRSGRTTIVRSAPYRVGMLGSERLALPLTRPGRALLRRRARVPVAVSVTAGAGARRTRTNATLRR